MSFLVRRVLTVAAFGLLGCSGATGGPVSGAVDSHCGAEVTTVVANNCAYSGPAPDAGVETEEVRYNAAADDDDCKYHVTFSSTPISQDTNVTFTVVLTKKSDGSPATGAATTIEASLTEKHPAPNSNVVTKETTPGTYLIGPVRFDAPGQWVTKFHFYEACSDVALDSPHGHVSFLVSVP